MRKKMPQVTGRTQIGLFASGAACLALTITIIFGKPKVGFGNSISAFQQRFFLILAMAIFAVQLFIWIRERKGRKHNENRNR